MADDGSESGESKKKRRRTEIIDSNNDEQPTKRLRKLGAHTENFAPDRLGALPPDLFKEVVDYIDDIKDLENLSLANKAYHDVLGTTVKDINQRKFTREAAAAIYDAAMSDGIPTVIWEETLPELMGDHAQPYAATAEKLSYSIGPIVRFLDRIRQGDFAAKIVATSSEIREGVIGGMVDHMRSFEPGFCEEIYEALIDDLENETNAFNTAGILEDATWRGNLTRRQLDRVMIVRMANPRVEQAYAENVRENYDSRFYIRSGNSNDRTHSTDRDGPYGVKMASDALKYNADRAARLDRFTEASKVLVEDAKTARGDMIAARKTGGRSEFGR